MNYCEVEVGIFTPDTTLSGRTGKLTNVLGLLACETWRDILPGRIRAELDEWALEESEKWSSSQATEAAWNYETMKRRPILGWIDNPFRAEVRVWVVGGSVTIPYFPKEAA